jgi:hypothetical protein
MLKLSLLCALAVLIPVTALAGGKKNKGGDEGGGEAAAPAGDASNDDPAIRKKSQKAKAAAAETAAPAPEAEKAHKNRRGGEAPAAPGGGAAAAAPAPGEQKPNCIGKDEKGAVFAEGIAELATRCSLLIGGKALTTLCSPASKGKSIPYTIDFTSGRLPVSSVPQKVYCK